MEYKYYYLYQITNLLNGKIYIGVHRANKLNDGYMGSGKILRLAILKHRIENFKKEILEFFESEEDMFSREIEYVDREFILRKDTYNITEGGYGGSFTNSSMGGKVGGKVGGKTCSKKSIGIFSKKSRENQRKYLISEENLKALLKMRERATSEESRDKRKEAFKRIKHQQGKKNNMFGTMWITNGEESTRIKSENSIPAGWHKGRIQKKNK